MAHPDLLQRVATYYETKLAAHGLTPQGVDWNSLESQQRRFRELLRLLDLTDNCSVIDYGCGYGALADYLHTTGAPVDYIGFDVSHAMIAAARENHTGCTRCRFVTASTELRRSDFTVASGIFNVKLHTPVDEWRAYVIDTVAALCQLTRRAVAFNLLSSYSDPSRRREDLYYADPLWLFDYCKQHFTPAVALLHDYPLFEFTLVLKLGDG